MTEGNKTLYLYLIPPTLRCFELTRKPPHTEQMVTMVLELQMLQESQDGITLVFLLSSERPCECSLTDSLSAVSEWPPQLLSPFSESVVCLKGAGLPPVDVEGSRSLESTPPSCNTHLGMS